MKKIDFQFSFLTLLIVLCALSRLMPHPFNFSPIAGLALFGSAHFKHTWQAFSIPLLAIWISDIAVNTFLYSNFTLFYGGFYWQYGAYLLIILFGFKSYKRRINVYNVLGGALGSSLIFFLISNFGVWAGGSFYPASGAGLLACYIAGIPFYQGTLAGNICYSALLFGGYYLLQSSFKIFKLEHIRYGSWSE